ncbi:MAG: hypothetical protein V4719_07925, partial [Planctomycetota bacterium]
SLFAPRTQRIRSSRLELVFDFSAGSTSLLRARSVRGANNDDKSLRDIIAAATLGKSVTQFEDVYGLSDCSRAAAILIFSV